MKGEQAMEIFEIVRQQNLLPEKIEDLVPLSFIGQSAVNFYRDKVKLMDQLEMTEEQRKATLKDGQGAGEMLLDIEARIGEICLQEPKIEGKRRKGLIASKRSVLPSDEKPKHERLGMDKDRVARSQQIAKHPEVVEYVKKQAKKHEEIPTKTAVLTEIKFRKSMEAKTVVVKDPPPPLRPKIDDVADETARQVGDLVSNLHKFVGNIQYIESALIKSTFKSKLNVLYDMIGQIRKEF